MHTVSDGWRESTSTKVLKLTEKEPGPYGRSEDASWALAREIDKVLGPEGGTLNEIYRQVTGPLGLSLSDTRDLVKNAQKQGYLR